MRPFSNDAWKGASLLHWHKINSHNSVYLPLNFRKGNSSYNWSQTELRKSKNRRCTLTCFISTEVRKLVMSDGIKNFPQGCYSSNVNVLSTSHEKGNILFLFRKIQFSLDSRRENYCRDPKMASNLLKRPPSTRWGDEKFISSDDKSAFISRQKFKWLLRN